MVMFMCSNEIYAKGNYFLYKCRSHNESILVRQSAEISLLDLFPLFEAIIS